MKTAVLTLLSVLLLFPAAAPALDVTSIYPEIAFVGTPVTVIGGPFGAETTVMLGGLEIVPKSVGSRQLIFITPELPVGEYALYLRSGGETSPETFSLRIEYPPPLINTVVPDNLDVCSSAEQRELRLEGDNILEGAQLLLDNSVVSYERLADQALLLSLPPMKAGSYGLQVINPDGKRSLPRTIWFNDIPEIDSVSAGSDYVNYYQLEIKGKNFFHNSVLWVSEFPGGFADLPPRQQIIPVQGGAVFRGEQARIRQTDNVIYQDCHTLVYNRYPPTGQSIRLQFRVSNPDGKQTSPYEAFFP